VGSNSCCDGMCLQLHCSRVCWHLQWHGVKGRLDLQKANTFNVSRGEDLPLPMILKTVFFMSTHLNCLQQILTILIIVRQFCLF
jgi:hypothetical protein